MSKCIGCGVILQNKDKNKVGYTPKEKITNNMYCERCFKINNYNTKFITKLDNINSYIISNINKKAKYVLFLIDYLNISTETINTYHQIKVKKSLVISKLDIIPKSINKEKLINFLKTNYNIQDEIFFQSTKKNLNTLSLINYLETNNIKEVYILGYANSGKSNLINKINGIYNDKVNKVTTSSIPNTTIDFIKIKVNDNLTIIDSPGFVYENTIYQSNEYDLIERINPKKFLKPRTFQTKKNTSFLIEDRIRIDANSLNSFTFYISNELDIKRFFNNNSLLEENTISLDILNNSDLVIKGLGFINIKKPCTIKVYAKDINLFEVRKSHF